MYPVIAVVPLFFANGLARIIEDRGPKVDPITLDSTISQIVESSMDQMRLRLRQAIYTLALKKSPRFPPSESGILSKYEEWLLDQFIAQIAGAFGNGSTPISREREDATPSPRISSPMHELAASPDIGQESHRMTIALETFTNEPLNYQHRKLITADDLRMMDSPAQSSETNENTQQLLGDGSNQGENGGNWEPSLPGFLLEPLRRLGCVRAAQLSETTSLLFRVPLWQLLLATFSFASSIVIVSTLVVCFRGQRRKAAFPKRTSLPFTLSGGPNIPDLTNTPESFLQRLGQLRRTETVVRERDDSEIWLHPSAARTSRAVFPEV